MTNQHSQAISAYKTAPMHPLVAVVRLYDEVLRRIARAIDDTRARRIEDAYINISRASLILRGLSSNLRFDKGEDIAKTLKNTYVTNMIALHTSFGKPDAPQRYEKIHGGLTELRNAWAETAGMSKVAAYKSPVESDKGAIAGTKSASRPAPNGKTPR
jgi:flagellar protein FliS